MDGGDFGKNRAPRDLDKTGASNSGKFYHLIDSGMAVNG